jgi:hypothetical protein
MPLQLNATTDPLIGAPMPEKTWRENIDRWRKLPAEEQQRISLRQTPRMVARSMAFEDEPVDQAMLER